MAGQLPARTVTERAVRLRHLGEVKKRAYLEGFLGAELDVLIMQRGGDGLWNGISRNYIPVAFAGTDSMANTEIRLRITDVTGDRLNGIIC
jgi:threonylcarbamoyladenosine tRNA methylthiotransferase MtaB